VINRLFFPLLLLTSTVALTASTNAQIFVLAHTDINDQRHIVPLCKTLMQDPQGPANYPGGVSVVCTANQNGVPIQTLPQCVGNTNAVCSVSLGAVIEGADYQTTALHGLIMQLLTNGCTQNGVLVNCLSDPLSYGIVSVPALPASRQFMDNGTIFPPFPPVGPTFWLPPVPFTTNALIASTTETQFRAAQVAPVVLHTRANDKPRTFALNFGANANWTFIGSGGTTTPAAPPTAPSQGTSIQFNAPSTVPVQQMDTLQGCKVDTSHGTDCSSAQIIVEVVRVEIPAGNPMDIPRPDNSTELLGGQTARYNATVIQGATTLVDAPVSWTFDDPSGLNLITVPPGGVNSSGFVTVAPQSVFQNNVFVVNITATAVDHNGKPIDPAVAVSAPFNIRISPATVTMTTVPSPGLNDKTNPDVYQAIVGRPPFNFAANVDGPQNPNNRVITTWDQDFIPSLVDFSPPGQILVDANNPNAMVYQIQSPPPKGSIISTTIKACVGGHLAQTPGSIALVGAQCAFFPMVFSAPVFPTSPPQTINSGESTTVTITGTGFGAAPVLSFSDPTVSFTPTSISGPDANGVTTVTGTMTSAPVPPPIPFHLVAIPVTITSSLPPPSTPVNQNVFVFPVTATPAVTPVNPTLLVSQSQQFTPTLRCLTRNGQSCTVPQTSTCSLFTGVGTMTASCLYTAPASLAAPAQVTGKACFTFGNICTGFSFNLAPGTVKPLVTVLSGETPFTYFLTSGGHVYTVWCTTSGCAWDDPSGDANAPAADSGSSLNVVSTANGLIAYFLTSNGHVIALNTSAGFSDTWQDITSAGGNFAAAAGSPLVTVVSGQTPFTYFLTGNGHVITNWCTTSGCTWDDPSGEANAPTAAAGSPLNVVATVSGLIAYFLTSNGHVIALNTSAGFSDTWQDITSAAGAPAAAIESSLTTVVSSNGTLITHFVVPEGHLVSISCTASGQCTSIDETANASAPPVAL
jgi:hypothetical protein